MALVIIEAPTVPKKRPLPQLPQHTSELQVASFRPCGLLGLYLEAHGTQRLLVTTTILKYIEYGLYGEYIRVLSKIIFYLLQDGCKAWYAIDSLLTWS